MTILFRRAVAIPVWAVCAVALGLGALGAPPFLNPSLAVLLGMAGIGSGALMLVRWLRARARTPNEAMNARNDHPADAADLMRMDDDGG
jgi:hypothetical protein